MGAGASSMANGPGAEQQTEGIVTVQVIGDTVHVNGEVHLLPGYGRLAPTFFVEPNGGADEIELVRVAETIEAKMGDTGKVAFICAAPSSSSEGAGVLPILRLVVNLLGVDRVDRVRVVFVIGTRLTPAGMWGGSTGAYNSVLTIDHCMKAAEGANFTFVEISNWAGLGANAVRKVVKENESKGNFRYNCSLEDMRFVQEAFIEALSRKMFLWSYISFGMDVSVLVEAEFSLDGMFSAGEDGAFGPMVSGEACSLAIVPPSRAKVAEATTVVVFNDSSKGYADKITSRRSVKKMHVNDICVEGGSSKGLEEVSRTGLQFISLIDMAAKYDEKLCQLPGVNGGKKMAVLFNTDTKPQVDWGPVQPALVVKDIRPLYDISLACGGCGDDTALDFLDSCLLAPDGVALDTLIFDIVAYPRVHIFRLTQGASLSEDGGKVFTGAAFGLTCSQVGACKTVKHNPLGFGAYPATRTPLGPLPPYILTNGDNTAKMLQDWGYMFDLFIASLGHLPGWVPSAYESDGEGEGEGEDDLEDLEKLTPEQRAVYEKGREFSAEQGSQARCDLCAYSIDFEDVCLQTEDDRELTENEEETCE